jgi:hypothetical protein
MSFQLDHPALSPFGGSLRSIVRMTFTGGLQALASLGVTMEAIKTDAKARSRFLRGCHRGYDMAQQEIGSTVIEIHRQIADHELELRQHRQNRDQKWIAIEERILVLRNRQIVLRRVADAILSVITRLDTWVLRRLVLDDQIREIDPVVLHKTLDIAKRRNAENRLRFSLIADLTTVAQVGDLIEVSFDSRDPRWKIIELKEGKVNDLLSVLLKENRSPTEEQDLYDEIAAVVGEHTAKQAKRMMRQIKRLEQVEELITTDKGTDPAHKIPMVITPDPVVTESYEEAIRNIVNVAATDGVGTTSLSGCLHLVCLRKDQMRQNYLDAIAHVFFHLREPGRKCLLGTDESITELKELRAGPPFVDLVGHSMRAQCGRPVFLWTDHERAVDLVMGDFSVFAQFDLEAFFELAGQEGIKMTWITGKAAEELKKLKISARIPGSPNAWGVKAIAPDGTNQTLLSGFVARVIADLTTPRQLLDLIKRGPEQAVKMGIKLE